MQGSQNTTREAIYAALFAKLSGLVDATTIPIPAGKVRYTSRKLRHWEEMSDSMPCILMSQVRESAEKPAFRGQPNLWKAHVKLYVYCEVGNDESITTPMTQLNGVLDALEAALAPLPAGDKQTLNGTCFDCRINGDIETDEGTLDTIAVAIVPVEIIA